MKKLFKGFAIAVGSLIAVGVLIGALTDSPAPQPAQTVTKEVSKPAPAPQVAKVGDTVKVGDVAFKVTKVETASSVGDEYLNKKASGKFLVLSLEVTNKGTEAVTIDDSMFEIVAIGSKYKASPEASTYANKDGAFFLQQLNPNLTAKGKMVFDLPSNAFDAKDLHLDMKPTLFSSDKGTINLK